MTLVQPHVLKEQYGYLGQVSVAQWLGSWPANQITVHNVEANCCAPDCRQIDREQLHNSINLQLID